MAARERLICASAELIDGGRGARFSITLHQREEPAFVVRYRGTVHAYLNRCGHLPIELDWSPGEFFDSEQRRLICSTHGALYDPASGRCVTGRCAGRGLIKVSVVEREGNVYVVE